MSKLVRYRFCTRSVEDFRPLVDMKPIGMPWWCTGSGHRHVTIVCYLPENEPLEKYWDDAFDICEEHVNEIVYTDRFQKPEWLERREDDNDREQ